MQLEEATIAYEAWLLRGMEPAAEVFEAQIKIKHASMSGGVLPFLRGSFYRWAELWPVHCPDLTARAQDRLLVVGDLHLENFGTWRDEESRLAWGVNDFDEACEWPFTSDLVRLATSVALASEDGLLNLSAPQACAAVLTGYQDACATGGQAFILDSRHDTLRDAVAGALESNKPEKFWAKFNDSDKYPALTAALPLPEEARAALAAALPDGAEAVDYRLIRKAKGLGSLGHPRYLALTRWRGGWVAREAKRLVPSAVQWLADPGSDAMVVSKLIGSTGLLRSPDPALQMQGPWMVRAVTPDAMKADLGKISPDTKNDPSLATALLQAMGAATAAIHLSQTKTGADLLRSLDELATADDAWLSTAAATMAAVTGEELAAWKAIYPPM